MNFINEYFKRQANRVTFMELKEDTTINIKGYPINENIPLPIITDVLIDEIKEGNLEEEIKLEYIINGIVYLMGIDPEFKYIQDYKKIIMEYNEKVEEYIFFQGIKRMEAKDHIGGAICFRALKLINSKNLNGIFNYAFALEEISKEYFEKEQEKEGSIFLSKSTRELESILDIDDKYPLAYYKLGYHYKFNNQYLKAKLIWTKYLTLDRDEIRLQEIRGEIELIENDVALESGLSYLSREYFEQALDVFLKLLPKFEKWWELKYLIGACYKGLGELEKAIDYFYESLDLYKEDSDVYNELGICLFTIEDLDNAIDVYTEGIENIQNDYKLLFNRGLCYLQLGNLEKAYEDISEAVKLNPNDENMNNQKNILDDLMNR
ncbi:tetratricopeptide repeat protein [Tissierella pigra]|uniref:Tetratricopeptide repeat protein n=1 Tax=Tissierella pigra TaxID=2607614 RepID=A0A6N7XY02_9FIRM|nr:tetratricopeptide repeat protein [Tissierella pigra]MBU5427293.1 tetratricopeptide repeat protein [Tissierella pigra]MSU01454.1 tetratricopeptide repeat protein [Tissierella pigra]